jgi:hypothetical protein
MFGGQLDLVHPTQLKLCYAINIVNQFMFHHNNCIWMVYIWEKNEIGEIIVDYVPTHEQKVDIFMKPLGCTHFFELTKCLGIDDYFKKNWNTF